MLESYIGKKCKLTEELIEFKKQFQLPLNSTGTILGTYLGLLAIEFENFNEGINLVSCKNLIRQCKKNSGVYCQFSKIQII